MSNQGSSGVLPQGNAAAITSNYSTSNYSTPNYNIKVIKQFSIMTIVWGIVGMLVGVIIAAQLVWPDLNIGPYLHFGRLRPLHTNAVIFAFGGSALFAASYHVVQRSCQATLISNGLAAFTFWGWQLIIVLAAITLPLAVLFYLALLSSIVAIGLMAHWMSKTYNAGSFPIKGMVLVGYANTPIFICGLLALYPVWWFDILIATVACCYSIRLLYMGVPKLMKIPDELGMLYASALFAVALVYMVVVLVATVILWEYVATPTFVDG
jgi:hypothetical protein